MDWTTGLTNFCIKHTGMLSKLPQELIVSNITLVLDLVFYIWRFRRGCDDLYHIFCFSLGYGACACIAFHVQTSKSLLVATLHLSKLSDICI